MVSEYLYRQINGKKVRETIDFLLNREETHNQMLFWDLEKFASVYLRFHGRLAFRRIESWRMSALHGNAAPGGG